ncbi:hypothetical protein SJR90_11760 [Aeromonas caviae]|uniref:hypothetical protein n=1 Tax=Aeromonas caviae TaxID=648 RepID=UPI000FB70949|nr:hypothetical protein [Aeromonas caviae]MDX7783013.1 hypothetical protein [Aeromonas caviae]
MTVSIFPAIKINGRNFLLAIHPDFHTRLFPDSKLNNESPSIITDVSHTNSIHKVYLTKMSGTDRLKNGDNILIYRMTDGQGPARFRSVATSVCVVEECLNIHSFATYDAFKRYCAPHSVFTEQELSQMYQRKTYPNIIKFTYNFALQHRVIRQEIMDITGYNDSDYWGFMSLSDNHFREILSAGGVNAGFIVN